MTLSSARRKQDRLAKRFYDLQAQVINACVTGADPEAIADLSRQEEEAREAANEWDWTVAHHEY